MSAQISVVILTSQGPRHAYFCRELSRSFHVKGIVTDQRYHFSHRLQMFLKNYKANPFLMLKSIQLKKKLAGYEARDQKIEEDFFKSPSGIPDFPSAVPLLASSDPNSSQTVQWVKNLAPDFIVVFGTRIIRKPMLDCARYAALNLHTGLSPYYRGGQCTFWCLYREDLEHIGVTVHHLSGKIDGGDIIYTAQPEIEAGDTVRSLECKLVELGTAKMIEALTEMHAGRAPKIPQREKGNLFLSKDYTLEKRLWLEGRLDQGLIRGLLIKKMQEAGIQ